MGKEQKLKNKNYYVKKQQQTLIDKQNSEIEYKSIMCRTTNKVKIENGNNEQYDMQKRHLETTKFQNDNHVENYKMWKNMKWDGT